MTKTATPGKATCADVAELLGIPLQTTVKSLVLATDDTNWTKRARWSEDAGVAAAAARRPRHERGQGWQGARAWRAFASLRLPEIEDHFGCKPGYLGPLNLQKPVKLVVDREVAAMADWVCGANEA